ncbi:uncharacterized protein LOC125698183 [Lagopus muta]|uniref:uncharacterized protein LOC125698183 n=1 Tax=Lagopus muta TaxID=64668 RepID=UPI0020A12796|nr:uncharacterized protein LOC125698183 [Lagopus muta]
MFKQKPTAPFDTGSRFPSPYRIREPRGRAARCAAPVGLLPSSAFPRLSPTRPSAQRCRKPPTERPAPPAARPCAHRSFPGGAQKARSHRTRARLTSPPPGFLEALYKPLPPTKTKGRQQKQAPHAPESLPKRDEWHTRNGFCLTCNTKTLTLPTCPYGTQVSAVLQLSFCTLKTRTWPCMAAGNTMRQNRKDCGAECHSHANPNF